MTPNLLHNVRTLVRVKNIKKVRPGFTLRHGYHKVLADGTCTFLIDSKTKEPFGLYQLEEAILCFINESQMYPCSARFVIYEESRLFDNLINSPNFYLLTITIPLKGEDPSCSFDLSFDHTNNWTIRSMPTLGKELVAALLKSLK